MAVRSADKWCVTDYDTFTSSFQWTIKKFQQRCAKYERVLESPIFSSGPGGDYKWQLKMDPSYYSSVSLHLKLVSKPDDNSRASVEMAIYANGKKEYGKESESEKLESNKEVGFSDFIDRDKLFTSYYGYLVDNSITLYCKVTVFLFAHAKHTTGSRYSIAVPECDVSTHFGSLLSSEEFSDVTLVVGKNELKGHRLVLSARSQCSKQCSRSI